MRESGLAPRGRATASADRRVLGAAMSGAEDQPLGIADTGARLSWREGLTYFAVAAAIDTFLGLRLFPAVLHGSLINPDTYMRLVRLREMLVHHAPVYIVARDGSGAGTLIYWSHLLDSLLLLLAAPLTLVMREGQALHWVAVGFGPISMGLLAVAIAWAAAPFTHRSWRWLVPVFAPLSPGILAYAMPGVAHHHIPVAAACVMMAGWALRSAWLDGSAGRKMGAWAAVAIWLTPEGMPFVLASFSGLGLFWMLHRDNPNPGAALRSAGTIFLVLIAAAIAVDPPFGGYFSAKIYRLSVVYLALAAIAFAVGWTAWGLDRLAAPPLRRSAVAVLLALAGLGLWLAAFPAILAGPAGLMNGHDTRIFLGAISEMQPLRAPGSGMLYLGTGALAVVALGIIAVRARSPLWALATICGGLLVVLALHYRRFSTYPEIIGVAILPVVMSAFDGPLARRPRASLSVARTAIAVLFLLFPLAAPLGHLGSRKPATAPVGASCDLRTLQHALRPYAGQIVLASPSDTPGLLYWTRVRTVASFYAVPHNLGAFLRLRAAWRTPPSDSVPAAVRATRAALVLICSQRRRSLLVADLPPDTLWDRLNAGKPPPWLVPVETDGAPGYRLYRIVGSSP